MMGGWLRYCVWFRSVVDLAVNSLLFEAGFLSTWIYFLYQSWSYQHGYSNIGLNAVLHQLSVINEGCMIGASAFFKGESESFSKYAGVPAKYLSPNIKK